MTAVQLAPRGQASGSAQFWSLAHAIATKRESERLQAIRSGFSNAWIVALRNAVPIAKGDFYVLIGLSESTLDRRLKQNKPLDPATSERLDRLASIAVMAEDVFEDKVEALRWLASPNEALGGETPLRHCETEIGSKQVRRILNAIEWGGVA